MLEKLKNTKMKPFFISLILILFLVSCQNQSEQKPIRLAGKTMGTTYHITYFDADDRNFQKPVDSVLKAINQSLSTYIPNSTISKINKNESLESDKYFRAVFEKSQEISQKTNGYFDCSVFPLVNAWGFGFEKMASNIDSNFIDSLLQLVDFQEITLEENKIFKKNKNARLGFGGIAKGFGVDEIGRFLESKNIKNYLVEIGGEVRARGKKPNQQNWLIQIEKPIDDPTGQIREGLMNLELENKSMAGSGNYRIFYIKDGKKYAHEINPKTGYPVQHNLLAVNVLAKDCMTADGYATAFMVMGLEKSKKIIESDSSLEAIFIFEENGTMKVEKLLK